MSEFIQQLMIMEQLTQMQLCCTVSRGRIVGDLTAFPSELLFGEDMRLLIFLTQALVLNIYGFSALPGRFLLDFFGFCVGEGGGDRSGFTDMHTRRARDTFNFTDEIAFVSSGLIATAYPFVLP